MFFKQFPYFLILISGLFLTGCFFSSDHTPVIHEIKGEVFGSYYVIKYHGGLKPALIEQELVPLFKSLNNEFSNYQKDSLVSIFNALGANKRLRTSERFIWMLKFCKMMNEKTGGAFEPTLGPVVRVWGFGGGERKGTPSDASIREALKKVGMKHVHWDEKKLEVWKSLDGVGIDTNSFVPGWAADLIGEMLSRHGINDYMVDISGEILVKGEKAPHTPWVVGIETPSMNYAESVQMALKIKDLAIATSGDYRQFFNEKGVRRSHIIDPRSGMPVNNTISSATVIVPSGIAADTWSTAMMVLGEEGMELAEKNGVKVYLLKATMPGKFEGLSSPSMKSYIQQFKL